MVMVNGFYFLLTRAIPAGGVTRGLWTFFEIPPRNHGHPKNFSPRFARRTVNKNQETMAVKIFGWIRLSQ